MAVELKDLTKSDENYSQWYNDLVIKAGLAENSAVRGCMVIKPYGYAIWEKMHDALDRMFKETGHDRTGERKFVTIMEFKHDALFLAETVDLAKGICHCRAILAPRPCKSVDRHLLAEHFVSASVLSCNTHLVLACLAVIHRTDRVCPVSNGCKFIRRRQNHS